MGDHNDADTLYNWGKLILRKAAYQSENLDLILLAAMKIKTAVETELKLGQYKVIRDTVDALETITKAPGSLAPAATARTQSWCKVLKTALDKLNQKASLKAVRFLIVPPLAVHTYRRPNRTSTSLIGMILTSKLP
jgi:hypothetical protein